MLLFLKQNEKGVLVKIKVQPRASKNEIKGIYGDALKVRLTAPPVDGEANLTCQAYFAKLCKVPKSRVDLVSGFTGRNKTILIEGMNEAEFLELIKKFL